jgi:hypothetical protein
VNLFALAGFCVLFRALSDRRHWWHLVTGLLFGLAIIMKQQALPMVVFAVLFLLYKETRPWPASWRTILIRQGLLVLGLVLPLAVTGLMLWRAGVLGRFWFWTIQYAAHYGRQIPPKAGWANFCCAWRDVVPAAASIWILGGIGLVVLVFKKSFRPTGAFVLGLLVFSSLAASAGLFFRQHYVLLVLPAVALLVATAIHSLTLALRAVGSHWSSGLSAAVFIGALAYPVCMQADIFFFKTPAQASRTLYLRNPFIESVAIGRYLREHCAPDQTIAIFGSEPELYFYSQRRSATGYIYTYALMEDQPYAMQMQHEMAAEIEAAQPEYVVCVGLPVSWLPGKDSNMWILRWAAAYYEKMELVAVADNLPTGIIYRWDKDAAGYTPKSSYFMAVYRRKAGP